MMIIWLRIQQFKTKTTYLEKINEKETISNKIKLNEGDFILVKYKVTKRDILYMS